MAQIPNGFVVNITPGYSSKGPGGVKRTEVAGGRARYGLDWDQGAIQFNVALLLDALQWQVWEAFYLIVVKKGSLPFDMYLDSGLGKSLHTVNIVPGSYSETVIPGNYTSIAFAVETESQTYLDPEAALAVLELYNATGSSAIAQDLLNALEYFANTASDVLDF